MKVKITTDKPMQWGGSEGILRDCVISEARNYSEDKVLTTQITTALSQMKYGEVKEIVIKKINQNKDD